MPQKTRSQKIIASLRRDNTPQNVTQSVSPSPVTHQVGKTQSKSHHEIALLTYDYTDLGRTLSITFANISLIVLLYTLLKMGYF